MDDKVIGDPESQIVVKKLTDLQPWKQNPREIDEQEFDALQQQITRLGVYKPLIVDGNDGTILGGNMRYRALIDLGYEEVICSLVYPESEAMRLEYALSDNDLKGDTIEQALAELLWQYEDFPLNLYKVHLGKASNLEDVKSKFGPDLEPEDEEDEPPIGSGQKPVSQRGVVYQLGDHRLMCGDSTDPTDVERLMGGELADLIFTDPPYMVDYHDSAGETIENENLSEEDAGKFYDAVLQNLYDFSKPHAPIYWWYAMRNHNISFEAFRRNGWHFGQTIIWLKNSMVFSPGQDFHMVYEPCMFGWKANERHFSNKRIATYKDVMHLDLQEFESILDLWYEARDNVNEYVHPTQKPAALALRALRKHTRDNGIVLDLFGGSGSTLLACQQFNRRAYVMELDPKFCDAIRKRYAKSLGKDEDWERLTPEVQDAKATQA